jgi:hypothetical protein
VDVWGIGAGWRLKASWHRAPKPPGTEPTTIIFASFLTHPLQFDCTCMQTDLHTVLLSLLHWSSAKNRAILYYSLYYLYFYYE